MIERSHLKILREVDRHGSLTAAANELFLTQSALSHTMRKLESQLGTPLWIKEGRHLQLTQAGRYLLKEAKRLLPQLERLDETLLQYAQGDKGVLRIGMECHPCYQWLLKVVKPFLADWPSVDVDVKQKFQFGGMAALFNHDIDILVTPDPIEKDGIRFSPVFDYEQVLVVHQDHPYAQKNYVQPKDLANQVLYTYPVDAARLDIFQLFLFPAMCSPKQHKMIEATEMMLQMVAANRGVATLPKWLVEEYQTSLPIQAVRLGKDGIQKQIHLGIRSNEEPNAFTQAFFELATGVEL
ncbi:LysR family transcriptional regulator [Litoribrevibacter albus]|uniref:HTH-type transcriptional regulator MetR n=1 Tax=Litoribrevibacter albus TaxID=1473156 RepID=A0AA37W7M8_9GAMM|nr:LysR family transcriptional regulator [Litoribrevibacter albus]GLQ32770.1 LysR family transcriptional regulator [Litoribrevibacter albus]